MPWRAAGCSHRERTIRGLRSYRPSSRDNPSRIRRRRSRRTTRRSPHPPPPNLSPGRRRRHHHRRRRRRRSQCGRYRDPKSNTCYSIPPTWDGRRPRTCTTGGDGRRSWDRRRLWHCTPRRTCSYPPSSWGTIFCARMMMMILRRRRCSGSSCHYGGGERRLHHLRRRFGVVEMAGGRRRRRACDFGRPRPGARPSGRGSAAAAASAAVAG
mmetsp:Transcript_37794/g.91085  ORF Transcript_37794/g.91085 Transcript_37794/m.91085 type:complete len:211 (-) Transcript_37794:146-778(-)